MNYERLFRNIGLCALFVFSQHLLAIGNHRHAITYGGGSRFGDQLSSVAHARYLSYITSVPFLNRSLVYGDSLYLDYDAYSYDQYKNSFSRYIQIHSAESLLEFFRIIRDPSSPPTLFTLEYFPTDMNEWDFNLGQYWCIFLSVPWKDEAVKKYLNQCIRPRIQIPDFTKPGRLNVAVHVRTLSGPDTLDTSVAYLPLKFPNLEYHRRQIKKVYEWNSNRPMYVFLFSDTYDPKSLVENFRKHFIGYDIIFDIQLNEKAGTRLAVQDFYAMQKFNVLIATHSNFSMMAWRLGSLDMVIFPVHIKGKYPDSHIDRIQVISKKSNWFPYELECILREEEVGSDRPKDWFPIKIDPKIGFPSKNEMGLKYKEGRQP